MSNSTGTIRSLHREWTITALAYAVSLGAGCWALAAWLGVESAARWLLTTCLIAALILVGLRRNLTLNHRRAEADLLPGLGAGTALTLLRGLLLAFLGGFLPLPRPSGWLSWLPAACYLAAALIDYGDGYVARITHHATPLGEKLDLDLDALGILLAPLLAVLYGRLPVWYLLVSIARYLFGAGVWLLKRQGKPVYNLTQSERRRGMAGLQMGLNVAVLLPPFGPPGTTLTATVFMIPFLIGFVRDWLVVSGALYPQSGGYQIVAYRAERVFYGWLPIPFRLAASGLVVYWLLTGAAPASGRDAFSILIMFQIILAALILAGVLGRLAALVSLVASGLVAVGANLNPLGIGIVIALTGVLFFGSGHFSVWQPEESFLRYHAGAAH